MKKQTLTTEQMIRAASKKKLTITTAHVVTDDQLISDEKNLASPLDIPRNPWYTKGTKQETPIKSKGDCSMKYYEFVVIKNGWMMGSFRCKSEAIEAAKTYANEWPSQTVEVKAHVYDAPLNQYDVGDHYLYSYNVSVE